MSILNKKNIKVKGIFIVLFVLLCLFLISLAKEAYRNYKISKEIKNLKNEIQLLKSENIELNSLVDYLKTPNFAEKEARLKFGLKKNGEKVFNLEGLKNKSSNELNREENEEDSNFKKWQKFFFANP